MRITSKTTVCAVLCALVGMTAMTSAAENTTASVATYTERYRPQFHFTTARNWINDPNGLVYIDGEYHMFYQYNPEGDKWGHMSWGHAVSPDLLHWKELPVAIPELADKGIMIFSGSAVADLRNTSGLGKPDAAPLLAAFYTAHQQGKQAQALAYSTDRGRTFTQYERNPLIDINQQDFRDPKVFWHAPSKSWIMCVALPLQHQIQFYRSADLKKWSLSSTFGPAGDASGIWECPDLFPVKAGAEEKWVLMHSVGKTMQYFVGEFDGETFQNLNPADLVLRVDHGPDYFAAITFNNMPADAGQVSIGWMSNWNYAADLPTSPWRGQMSIPRELSLRETSDGLRLVQQPVSKLKRLRADYIDVADETITATLQIDLSGNALEIITEIEPSSSSTCGLKVAKGPEHETVIGYDSKAGELYIDRSRSGESSFNKDFGSRYSAPLKLNGSTLKLHIFLDASSVEVFAEDGLVAMTALIFPDSNDRGVEFFAESTPMTVKSAQMGQLSSIWNSADDRRIAR